MRTLKFIATSLGIAVCISGSVLVFGIALLFAASGFVAVTKGNAHGGLVLFVATSGSLALTLLLVLAGRALINSVGEDDKPGDDEDPDE